MPKISLIIPVYKGEKVLERCIESILSQDYTDYEALLVDDGSKDASWIIMQNYAKEHPQLRVFHKENGGVSSTRNYALDRAEGEYVRFMDVDDYLPMDSLKLMIREMEKDPADLIVADFYREVDGSFTKHGSFKESGRNTLKEYADEMLKTPADLYFGALWNKLYKRSIIEEYHLRMKEDVSYAEDMIFNLDYLKHVKDVYVLRSPVYYYVYTKGSLVAQNMDIAHTVKMKTTVLKYYEDFYRTVFSEEEYNERFLLIYAFLIAVSTDFLSIPGLAKKVKEDNNLEVIHTGTTATFHYYSLQLLDRYLTPVSQKYNLDQNDIRVLYGLSVTGRNCSPKEISAFTGVASANVLVSLAKLVSMGYVKMDRYNPFESLSNIYRFDAPQLIDDFKAVEKDYRNTALKGMSEEEIKVYLAMRDKVYQNLKAVADKGI